MGIETGSIVKKQKAEGIVTILTKLEIKKLMMQPVLDGLYECNRFPVQGNLSSKSSVLHQVGTSVLESLNSVLSQVTSSCVSNMSYDMLEMVIGMIIYDQNMK